ncbi:MAG TPA: hypothetical protein VGQ81_00760 [Acidobacteriota bacterium]|nr:hypothetical protein [Acidobacteriota bacterium]
MIRIRADSVDGVSKDSSAGAPYVFILKDTNEANRVGLCQSRARHRARAVREADEQQLPGVGRPSILLKPARSVFGAGGRIKPRAELA